MNISGGSEECLWTWNRRFDCLGIKCVGSLHGGFAEVLLSTQTGLAVVFHGSILCQIRLDANLEGSP